MSKWYESKKEDISLKVKDMVKLSSTSYLKAQEICGTDKIVRQGYERRFFNGFGGRIWYQCQIDKVWYQFGITRRINSSEPQVYSFEQKTTFPNNFNLSQ